MGDDGYAPAAALTVEQALERARRGSAAPLLAAWEVVQARVVAPDPPLGARLELSLARGVGGPNPWRVVTEVAFPLSPDEPTDPDLSDLVTEFGARFDTLLADLQADAEVSRWLEGVRHPRAVFDPLGADLRGRFLLVGHGPDGAHVTRAFPG